MEENVHPLLVSLDSNQKLTQGGHWKDSASVLPGAGLSSHGSYVHRTQRIHCPAGGLFCTRSSDKGRGCSQLPGGGEKGVEKGTSLALGHSC